MTTKTQSFVAEIEFVKGILAKRGMYKATVPDRDLDGYQLHTVTIGDEVRRSDLEKVFASFGELKEVC